MSDHFTNLLRMLDHTTGAAYNEDFCVAAICRDTEHAFFYLFDHDGKIHRPAIHTLYLTANDVDLSDLDQVATHALEDFLNSPRAAWRVGVDFGKLGQDKVNLCGLHYKRLVRKDCSFLSTRDISRQEHRERCEVCDEDYKMTDFPTNY